MLKRIFTLTITGLLSCMLIGALASDSDADYGNYADRLSREHRIANDVDEWIERGNATITASPLFEDGMRLTAWANNFQDSDKFQFAIASGVYLFEIPRSAQTIEIVVRYKGEPHTFEINDQYEPIAGRVWIRNIKREMTRRGYHDQSASETRYGDTFVLRAKNRSETIKIPVAGHVQDGWMELHVVAEGGEQLDVEYIEVSTYRRAPKLRVVQHYTPSYRWRPWNRYTYLYFYDGPVFYSSGYDSYLCWSYPVYDHRYLSIRTRYGGYLGRYRTYHPARYSYYYTPYHGGGYGYGYGYGRGNVVYSKRTQLNRWSAQHANARKQYSRSRLAVPTRTVERTQINNNVRAVIENHRRQAPPATERLTRSALISQKQRAATRSSIRTNDASRTYSSRSRYSNLNSDNKRRILHNTRSRVNSGRSSSSAVTERSSRIFRRSITSSSSRSGSSSSSNSRLRSSNSSSRTQRSTPAVTTTQSKTRPTSTNSSRVTPSRSSRTRSATTSRTRSSSSSSSDDDDDDDDNNNNSRSRSSERIKRRR